jgi:hypothetical protein
MKYLLPLTLLASAAWAAAHDSGSRDSLRDAKTASETVRGSDPPWLTGELEVEDVASDEIDDPHAGLYGGSDEDDPHSGLFMDGDVEMGMCTRDDAADAWSAGGDADLDPDLDPHLGAHRVTPGVELPRAPLSPPSAANGHSIAELHAQRARLAEQQVRVRGTVVKLTDGILGETYLHLRDGTGSSEREDDDLTVTTTDQFELGETIEVEGRLRIDQDLGLGYRYPVLLAGATHVVQH